MIRIKLTEHDGKITMMKLTGHSGSAEAGKDLVCAGVSSITFGLCNALDEMRGDVAFEVGDNSIKITVNSDDEKTQWILKTGVIQLKTIEEVNKDFIKINITEV